MKPKITSKRRSRRRPRKDIRQEQDEIEELQKYAASIQKLMPRFPMDLRD